MALFQYLCEVKSLVISKSTCGSKMLHTAQEIRVLRYLHAHGPPCMGPVKLLWQLHACGAPLSGPRALALLAARTTCRTLPAWRQLCS